MVSKLFRQVMTVALGCVVATFAVGGLAACANNDEQAIRAGITKENVVTENAPVTFAVKPDRIRILEA